MMDLANKLALDGLHVIVLIEHQPHAIPGAAKKIPRTHGFQRDQRMFGHEFAVEREFHHAHFLAGADRRESSGCLYSILAFSLPI